MTQVQFGWGLPRGPRDKAQRESYVSDIRKGFDLIVGRFDSAWMVDHLQFGDVDLLEAWTTIAYLAAEHQAFRFGHVVLCQSFRNPALLAKMAATLQFLSGNRYILGIGAGWHEEEYRAYGYDYPPAGTRVQELDETLQIVKALWTEDKSTVQGKHYQVVGAYCEPKPAVLPPIMVGAFKPHMLRLTARHADWWSVSFTKIDDYRTMAAECERACVETGRDPATLRRTWYGGCICAPTEAEVAALNRDKMPLGRNFVGTPDQIIDQMRPFVDLGVDYFQLSCGGFPELTTLDLLMNEVLPALNGA
jgi:alkanesulfonate monooxygenase SsuD/methylene tetrahydromethanopterin reductase-like flavin-dependent oxidoreductase (luciferase family)